MFQAEARAVIAIATTLVATAALATAAPDPAPAAPAPATPDETQPDDAALRAIVKHWSRAEYDGDVAYLAQLLAPEYRSISPKGEARTRAALLEHAERRRGSAQARAEARKAGEAYLQAHPTETAVIIHGALGIVSYFDPARGVDHSVRGSDVFVYESNRWRAIYSLHNAAE